MPYLKDKVLVPEPLDCRILSAALDLFAGRGYHNVSIHDIQRKANVSIGSIYNHFGSAIRMIHLRLDGLIDRPLPQFYDELIETVWQGLILEPQGHVLKAVPD